MKGVKKMLLLLILAINICDVFSQETKQMKKFISPTLIEKYSALKSDKHIKEGPYMVTDLNNHILVLGQYKNNKKDSIWNYIDEAGHVIQKYNFTDSTLLVNNTDKNTIVQVDYKIDDLAAAGGGIVNAPCQIGGANYGFYLFFDQKNIPAQVKNQTSVVKMIYNLTIDTIGKLTYGSLSYVGAGLDLTESIAVKNLPADVFSFLPAKIDGKVVNSNLLYTVDLNINKSRLPRANTSPTQDDSRMSQGVYH